MTEIEKTSDQKKSETTKSDVIPDSSGHTVKHNKPSEQPPNNGSQLSEASNRPTEVGGPRGLEPTRYGDWEQNGRCTDF